MLDASVKWMGGIVDKIIKLVGGDLFIAQRCESHLFCSGCCFSVSCCRPMIVSKDVRARVGSETAKAEAFACFKEQMNGAE